MLYFSPPLSAAWYIEVIYVLSILIKFYNKCYILNITSEPIHAGLETSQ